jgi:hypothetical protein
LPSRLTVPNPGAPVPWYPLESRWPRRAWIIGLLWDISWHRTIGRDAFLTPAHLAITLEP